MELFEALVATDPAIAGVIRREVERQDDAGSTRRSA